MNEQDLDRILGQEAGETPSLPPPNPKALRRALNRTLIPRILATVLAAALALAAVTWGTSAAMDALFYDPGREQVCVEQDPQWPTRDFATLVENTWSLIFPGETAIVTMDTQGETVHSRGFGRYTLEMKVQPSFAPLMVDHVSTHRFTLNRGEMKCQEGQYAYYINEFRDPERPELFYEDPAVSAQAVRAELENLPDSARLDVSISFAESMDAEETAALLRDFADTSFFWAALEGHHIHTSPQVAGGMPLYRSGAYPGVDASVYPNFTLPDRKELTGEDLRESLQSRLRLLQDHPDFLKATFHTFSLTASEVEERLDLAEQDFRCFGLRGDISKGELSRLLDTREVAAITVHDVKVSRFSK